MQFKDLFLMRISFVNVRITKIVTFFGNGIYENVRFSSRLALGLQSL